MTKETKFLVYVHTCPNGKNYVGMTSKTLEKRSRNGNGYYGNEEFYDDIRRYGWDNITHEVLKVGLSEEEAQKLEQHYIALWQTDNPEFGYNKSKGGEKPVMLGKQRSEELKRKQSEAMSGENNPMFGKHHKEETRQKQSEVKIGENNPMFGKRGEDSPNHGKHTSDETRRKQSEAHCGEKHPMYGKRGEDNPNYGKKRTQEQRKRMSDAQKGIQAGEKNPNYGKRWYNNGIEQICAFECPPGFVLGMLKRKKA